MSADRSLPEGRLARTRPGDGQQQRQGGLAFAEIIAGVLAQGLGRAAIVQRVIDQLEGRRPKFSRPYSRSAATPGARWRLGGDRGAASAEAAKSSAVLALMISR